MRVLHKRDITPTKFVEKDGKYVVEFDEIPALLFVSHDGDGRDDQLFVDGAQQLDYSAVTIRQSVGELTEYELVKPAVSWKEVRGTSE